MNLKFLKLTALGFVLVFGLSACQDIKGLLGVKDPVLDFPPGDYIGKAKLIGEKPSPGANGEVASPETKAAETKAPEPPAKVEPAKVEDPTKAKPGEPNQGAELKANEEKVEPGVLKEVPTLINPLERIQGENIKITFLPKQEGLTDGIGVLFINETSHRFFWRTDGNNKDTWNVLFTKDNNIYSNLHMTFNFDGAVSASTIENKIIGHLYIDNDSKVSEYYVEAYQFFKPKIIPPKEAIAIKGGDDIVIDVEKAGENPEEIKAILLGIPSEKQAASINELTVKNIEYDSKKDTYKVYIMTTKSLGKGEYSLYLIRSGAHKSNSIPIKV